MQAYTMKNNATLAYRLNSYGQVLLKRHGIRVHEIALDAGFTCPNRDSTKGTSQCTFCSNISFSPARSKHQDLLNQINQTKMKISKRTGAKRFIAHFRTYTNTYVEIEQLSATHHDALQQLGVIGISIGTRPAYVSNQALDPLDDIRKEGHEVWLELGLQQAFDGTLVKVNRGHTASRNILLAPKWCAEKWNVLNSIEQEFHYRASHQGICAGMPFIRKDQHDA